MSLPANMPAVLRTEAEWAAWIPNSVSKLFWPRAKADKGASWVLYQQSMLRTGTASIEAAYVFRLVPVVQTTSGVTQISQGGAVTQAGAEYETAYPNTLAEANLIYAANLAAECPLRMVRDAAPELGVRADIAENDMRAAVAVRWGEIATAHGKTLPELEAEQAAKPQGTGSIASRFFKDVGDWIDGVIVKNLGRVLLATGREILRLRNNQTWLGKFFFDPLGITAQAVLLEELGKAALDGSISTFNEARFGDAAGMTFVAAGQALAVAAPFLPVPFNVAAAALAAASIALGTTIQLAIANERNQREAAEAEEAARERQREAAERAALAAMEAEELAARAEQAGGLVLSAESPRKLSGGAVAAFAGTACAAALAVALALVMLR